MLVVKDMVVLTHIIDLRVEALQGDSLFEPGGQLVEAFPDFLAILLVDIVDILLQNGPTNQRDSREDDVVEGYVGVVKKALAAKAAVEGEVELWDGEYHVLVEEVQDHLGNTYVVPATMHQQ